MDFRRIAHCLLSATVLLGAASSLVAQVAPVPVTGSTLEVTLAGGERLEGELIEVSDVGLVLFGPTGASSYLLPDVSRVRAKRHDFSAGEVAAWVAIGGAATSIGLTAACNTVEGTSCGGVFAGASLIWGLVGVLAATGIAGSRWLELPVQRAELSPYARFPQGAPEGFGRGPF